MSGRFGEVAPTAAVSDQLARIDAHLVRLSRGHDPFGHLLAVERLARAARSEWMAVLDPASQRRLGQ